MVTGVPIADIERRVCQAYGVQARQLHELIQGHKNAPRLVGINLARKDGRMTYPAIVVHLIWIVIWARPQP